jgi:hypothetical protein
VGNLGLLAMRQEDYSTARACMEQYVHLVHTLRDVAGEINAWMLVSIIFSLAMCVCSTLLILIDNYNVPSLGNSVTCKRIIKAQWKHLKTPPRSQRARTMWGCLRCVYVGVFV